MGGVCVCVCAYYVISSYCVYGGNYKAWAVILSCSKLNLLVLSFFTLVHNMM